MKHPFLMFLFAVAIAFIIFVTALYVPTALPAHSDFSALYNTDLALVNRVPIYDIPKVEALAQQHSSLPPESFFLARFPYPPWYALSTFYLGLLPANAAATLWFELNLVMLSLSVWLLTDGWSGRLRLIAFPLALFFLPVLGALSVGQYDFPVLLGTSMLIYALRKENISLTTAGIILLTFKPHIGALILFSVVGWLLARRNDFGRRVIHLSLIAGAFLFAVGFLADPSWIVSYPKMLLNYQSEGNVAACSECASLPVWLSKWFFHGSLSEAAWISIALLLVLVSMIYFVRSSFFLQEFLISAAVLVTLLVSPYLYNYDFLLLLVPFAVLANKGTLIQKIIVILCYLIPTFALILFGREGNISLILVSVVMMLLLYIRVRNPVIDGTAQAA